MKRACVVGLLLALGIGGCVSTEERAQAIEKLALEAKQRAYDGAKKVALAQGVSPEQAEAIATKAAEEAYKLAKAGAEQIPSTGGLGKILTTLFYGLIQFGLPMLGGRKVEA